MPDAPQDNPTAVTHPGAEIRQSVWIVIAAYNEAGCITGVVSEVAAVYPNVVVVDDGSADETSTQARRATPHVLRHLINRGQGAALQTGIEYALHRGASYIVTFDADGQHRVEDIPRLLNPIVDGEVAITLGSRFLQPGDGPEGIPLTRKIILKMGVVFTRVVNRMPLTDAHNGFRAFSRDAAQQIKIRADRMAHASEMIDLVRRTGLPWKEIPVRIRYTEYSLAKGQSSGNAIRIVFHYLLGRIFG